jgi:hypothetical protein
LSAIVWSSIDLTFQYIMLSPISGTRPSSSNRTSFRSLENLAELMVRSANRHKKNIVERMK